MILWGFLGQVDRELFLELTSGHLPEQRSPIFFISAIGNSPSPYWGTWPLGFFLCTCSFTSLCPSALHTLTVCSPNTWTNM